jgi:GDPmannose 4,6-dehydratase
MNKQKVACIIGINGQDGSYLTEFLLKKGYEVWGIIKRNSISENQTERLDSIYKDHIGKDLKLKYGDLNDMSSLIHVLQESQSDEIYNLGAQSHVRISFDQPIYTTTTNAVGTLNLLESMRLIVPKAKFYQASSSEMFGNNVDEDGYQRETTRMSPVSPYGCSKLFGFNIVKNYRHSYGLFASNGILFNHESPRRGTNFVTNKVVKGAVEIKYGLKDELILGNLTAKRDWGHAKDFIEAMWLILQRPYPEDFVCATGISHSVGDLVRYVFGKLKLNEHKYIKTADKYLRPEELHELKGDPTRLKMATGWKPKYTFERMLSEMIEYWDEYYHYKMLSGTVL